MSNFTYPDVSNVEVVATQPKPADVRSMQYIQSTENVSFDNVTYVVKIYLNNRLPAMSLGMGMYLDDYYVREYSGFNGGIYLKVNNPRFFEEHAGKQIRFSVDGETFYDTGIRLPNLAESGRRGLAAAEVEALPTQEEVLNN